MCGRSDRIILEGRVELTPYIVARLHRQRLFHHRRKFIEGMVEPEHVVRQPADVVLRRHDLELRKAFEDATENDRRQRALHLVNEIRIKLAHLGLALARARQTHRLAYRAHVTLFALAGDDMQRKREVMIGGGLPERIVDAVAVGLVLRWRAPDHRAAQALLRTAVQLFDSRWNIFERNQRGADETLGIVRAELREPVVVRAEACALQVGVAQVEERHAEGSVEHFGLDAVDILVLDALGRVPSARTRCLVASFHMLFELFTAAAGAEAARNRERIKPRAGEDKTLAVRLRDYSWSLVLELFVDMVDPEVRGLHHMRIRRYQSKLRHNGLLILHNPY